MLIWLRGSPNLSYFSIYYTTKGGSGSYRAACSIITLDFLGLRFGVLGSSPGSNLDIPSNSDIVGRVWPKGIWLECMSS